MPSIVPLEASYNLEHKFNTNNELEVCRQNLYEAIRAPKERRAILKNSHKVPVRVYVTPGITSGVLIFDNKTKY